MRAIEILCCTGAILSNSHVIATSGQQYPLSLSKNKKPIKDIPSTGLGLWNSRDDNATNAIKFGFEAGLHHINSAAAYFNEDYVGKALNSKHAPKRSSYWVTSKLWNDMQKPENVPKALAKTLSDLDIDYLDLHLMHWPVAFKGPGDSLGSSSHDLAALDDNTTTTSIVDTWKGMEQLGSKNLKNPKRGTTRHIGISNFSPAQVQQILDICTICPYAHEFEVHQSEYLGFHRAKGIKVIAYSPLANTNPTYRSVHPEASHILEGPFWIQMAKNKNMTVAQAILGWGLTREPVVIPKSTHENRIVEDLKAKDVRSTIEEIEVNARQDRRARFNNPSREWGVKLFEGLEGIDC